MGMRFQNSDETCEWVREQTDTVFLGFSGGKDSLASWLKLLRFFDKDKIIPVCQLYLPGPPERKGRGTFPYLERVLDYYERQFDRRIYRIPIANFFLSMGGKTYQPPYRFNALHYLRREGVLPPIDHIDLERILKEATGMPNAWTAAGIKISDGLMRRIAIKKHGSALPDSMRFYPVWDYSLDDIMDEIRASGMALSEDYYLFGRSFGGVSAAFTTPVRDNSPEDWRVLKYWYPLADVDIMRYELRDALLDDNWDKVTEILRRYEPKIECEPGGEFDRQQQGFDREQQKEDRITQKTSPSA